MAADERLSEIVAFVREYAEAEAQAARAAMEEPDDDRYLTMRERVAAHVGPGIRPVVNRFATPGGRDDTAAEGRGQGLHPRVLFAVAAGTSDGEDAWTAYVSELRDPAGASIDQALSIARVDGHPLVVGRDTADPFVSDLVWEHHDGRSLPLDRVTEVRLERLPLDPQHAALLRDLIGRAPA